MEAEGREVRVDMNKMLKALVVDDEKVIREFLERFLTMEGFGVKGAEDGAKAVEMFQQEKFDVVFLDVRMPRMDGREAFRRMRAIDPESIYVMMTGHAVDDLLEETKREGAHAALRKPFELEILRSEIATIKKLKGV
jgi:CheY-like chemotaxis protein